MKRLTVLFALFAAFLFSGAAAAVQSQFQNGTFEVKGDFNLPYEWEVISWGGVNASSAYPVAGKTGYGVQLSIRAPVPVSSDRGLLLEPRYPVSVTAGEVYTYSDVIKGNGVIAYLDVRYFANGKFVYQGLGYTKTSSVWTTTTKRITVPAGATAMWIYRVITGAGTVVIDNVSLTQTALPATTGYASFTFDDGISQVGVSSLLSSLKVKGTFYLNPDAVIQNWGPSYLTLAQVSGIVAAGHEIGNHTASHYDLRTLTPEALIYEVAGGKRSLEELTGRQVFTFSYPYGVYDAASLAIVQKIHLGARTTNMWANNTPSTPNRYELNSVVIHRATTLAEAKAYAYDAYLRKQWIIFTFHGIDNTASEYGWSPANLSALVTYVKSLRMPVITVREGVTRYSAK